MSLSFHDRRWFELCVAAAASSVPGAAMAELTPQLAVDTSVALSSNPLLIAGSDREAVVAEISVNPSIRLSGPTGSSLDLSGVATQRWYSRRYRNRQLGNIQADGVYRDSERLSVLASAAFDRGLLADLITSGGDAAVDAGAIRERYSGNLSLQWRPNAKLRIEPEARYEETRYPDTTLLHDTKVVGGGLRLSLRTSPYTSLGFRGAGVRNHIKDEPDFTTWSGFVTAEQRLSSGWRAAAELGAERTGARRGTASGSFAPTPARTLLAGSAELCREGTRTTGCLRAAYYSEASGLGGLERRLETSLSLTHRITERLTLGLTGNYQRARLSGTSLPPIDAVHATAALGWRLNPALTVSTTAEYRRREVFSGPSVSAGFVGIRARFEWRRR